MGTYIIHFDDKPWEDLDDEQYYRCKEIPWFSTTKTTISRLTPYTEPDLEQVRIEAYQEGKKQAKVQAELDVCHDIEKVSKENYKAGLSDAWEAARKICTNWVLPDSVLSKIFGMDKTIDDIMKESTASEAIEKIRTYEQAQKEKEEQIQVGDEVFYGNTKGIVIRPEDGDRYASVFTAIGEHISAENKDLTKTGRHFPELVEILQKMKETNNG